VVSHRSGWPEPRIALAGVVASGRRIGVGSVAGAVAIDRGSCGVPGCGGIGRRIGAMVWKSPGLSIEAARPIPGARSRGQNKESSHGSQSTAGGDRVERAGLFSDPDHPSDAASGGVDGSPCLILRRSGCGFRRCPGIPCGFPIPRRPGSEIVWNLFGASGIGRWIGNLSPRT
jgi:hypothetical protein